MSEKKKDFLYNMLAGAVIAVLVFALGVSREYEITRCVCDGLFVAAVLLIGIGGLKGIRNKGVFDVAGYGIKSAIEIIPMFRRDEKETIGQYRDRKASERKGASGMLLAGVIYLALSFAALGVYYAVK